MKIYQYDNYNQYVEEQAKANKRKLHWVYVTERTIDHIKRLKPQASAIICHGTRNAAEQKMFAARYPGSYIMGTEISDTASQFPMTIQWDFTNQNPEWINKFDIVYSNAFDHSVDPVKTLTTWIDQLSSDGLMFIEHSEAEINNISSPSDPLEITHVELVDLFTKHGLAVVDKSPGKRQGSILFAMRKI